MGIERATLFAIRSRGEILDKVKSSMDNKAPDKSTAFVQKAEAGRQKFKAIRSGSWSRRQHGHDLSITVLRTAVPPEQGPRHVTIIPRYLKE